tara:strand:+ start:981 stop:2267 length:1287 start_codon:yes stop_codon:yes gene_type:complete
MNRSYSKIRHIQEVNQRLENRLLNEQTPKLNPKTPSIPPVTTGGCNGNNQISEPIITVKEKDNIFTGKHNTFELKMFFKATGIVNEDFQKGFTVLKNQIMAKVSDPTTIGGIEINDIRSVWGSASNYYNAPLQPTKNNNGGDITDTSINANLEGPGKTNYDKNLKFAESRWSSIYNYIKTNGKSLGFSITDNINPKTFAYITDTGGCTDEKRDSARYPNPGQYAIISGEYRLIPSDIGITKIKKCINKLKVVVGYFTKKVPFPGGITSNTAVQKGHKCDFATFDVYCNNIFLATVNLNNGSHFFKGNSLAKIGAEPSTNTYCSIDYNAPTEEGGTVYTVLSLTNNGITEIIKQSDSGTLSFYMTGNKNALTDGGKVHGSAPTVLVYNALDKRILYDAQPGGFGTFVKYDTVFQLGTFDACPTPAITKK